MIFWRHRGLPGSRRSQVTARPTDPRIKLSGRLREHDSEVLVPASAAESASEHPIARRPPKTPAAGATLPPVVRSA
jgi:hypothetical protein